MFEYIIVNNEVTITSIIDESVTEITIPESIDGLPVTNINNRCLRFCNSLININISSSVNSIHYYTFSCCGSLTYINGVKLKIGVNIINNKFITINKRTFKIKHQITDDYISDDGYYFMDSCVYSTL